MSNKNNFPKVKIYTVVEWEEDSEKIYEKERSGYYLLTSFQCDLCHFRNIQIRNTDMYIPEDETLMVTIWRALLGNFWSQDTGNVRVNQTMLKKTKVIVRE